MSRLRLSDSGRAVADVGGLVPGDRELSQCKFLIALTSICEAHHRYRGTEKSIDDEVHLKNNGFGRFVPRPSWFLAPSFRRRFGSNLRPVCEE